MSEQAVAPEDVGPMLAIDRFMNPARRFYRGIGVAMIALMLILPALQVLMRQVFRAPFMGSEELTRFMLICVVFVTLPYITATGANIRMEELLHALPARLRKALAVIIPASGALALAVGGLAVSVAMLSNLNNATPTLGIPYYIFFSAALFGFVFGAIESVIQVWKALAGHQPYVHFADEESNEPAPNIV